MPKAHKPTIFTVLRLLQTLRNDWVRERFTTTATGCPDYLNGVLRGLSEAVDIAKQCHEEAMKIRSKVEAR